MADSATNGNGLGWKLFFILAAFVVGNGTSYVAFGLNTMTRTDYNAAQQATINQLSAQNNEIEALRQQMERLVGELKGRKEIDGNP